MENLNSARGERPSHAVWVWQEHPRGSSSVYAMLRLQVAILETLSSQSTRSFICKFTHKIRIVLGYHPPYDLPKNHGAPRLALAMSTVLIKPQRASSRHCMDAGVYGDTLTAMNDKTTPLLFAVVWRGSCLSPCWLRLCRRCLRRNHAIGLRASGASEPLIPPHIKL